MRNRARRKFQENEIGLQDPCSHETERTLNGNRNKDFREFKVFPSFRVAVKPIRKKNPWKRAMRFHLNKGKIHER